MRNVLIIAGLAILTSACAGGSGSGSATPRVTASTPATGFRAPQVMRGSGIDSVIGQPAVSLSRRFGEARIDLAEGDARKLQYVSDRCVLDIFLYPLAANADPVATHVEARERQGGAGTDRAGCIAEVERAANSG